MTRWVDRWDELPAAVRLTDAQMHERYPRSRTWDPERRVLPADAHRCVSPAQGDTGAHALLIAQGVYYRCTLRRRGFEAYCTRHLSKALLGVPVAVDG